MAGRPPKYKSGRMIHRDLAIPAPVIQAFERISENERRSLPDLFRIALEDFLKAKGESKRLDG